MYFRVSANSDERNSTFEKVAAATSNFSAFQKKATHFHWSASGSPNLA